MQLTAARDPTRVARGDWQTPPEVCDAVVRRAAGLVDGAPATVLEPSCGDGAFLAAAAARWPAARLVGLEIDAAHAARARARLAGTGATILEASAFAADLARAIEAADGPVLALGNPPWVTLATLGALGVGNQPPRARPRALAGLDAITGRANFDLAEWIAIALARALAARGGAIALLCKASVARRLVARAAAGDLPLAPGAIHHLDARRVFGVSVDAALLAARVAPAAGAIWPVHASIDDERPGRSIALEGGALVADAAAFARTRHLAGEGAAWRSGVKHDCAAVMELVVRDGALHNGLGERVAIEPDRALPLLKGTDVARGRLAPRRAVVVPQRALGEDTARLAETSPATWAYLARHRARLDARRSKVYAGRPPFSIFGVGPYAFAPFKVAVSGLHPQPAFAVVGPHEGRPVLLDDTCYFLPFEDEPSARRVAAALASPLAADFFRARVFPGEKRPVTKALLASLDLAALGRALG